MSDPALVQAREALWRRDLKTARAFLSQAIAGQPGDPVALAYRSLCFRMEGKKRDALSDAAAALASGAASMEACAAQTIALVSVKKMREALISSYQLRYSNAHDAEGHFLHLLAFALTGESHRDVVKKKRDLSTAKFVEGPAARCAKLVLECRYANALRSSLFSGGGLIALAGTAAAGYRAAQGGGSGVRETAHEALQALERDLNRMSRDVEELKRKSGQSLDPEWDGLFWAALARSSAELAQTL